MNRAVSAFLIGSIVLLSVTALLGLIGLSLYDSGKITERERGIQSALESDRREQHQANAEPPASAYYYNCEHLFLRSVNTCTLPSSR